MSPIWVREGAFVWVLLEEYRSSWIVPRQDNRNVFRIQRHGCLDSVYMFRRQFTKILRTISHVMFVKVNSASEVVSRLLSRTKFVLLSLAAGWTLATDEWRSKPHRVENRCKSLSMRIRKKLFRVLLYFECGCRHNRYLRVGRQQITARERWEDVGRGWFSTPWHDDQCIIAWRIVARA